MTRTLNDYIEFLNKVKDSNLSLSEYCKENTDIPFSSINNMASKCRKRYVNGKGDTEEIVKFLNLYSEITDSISVENLKYRKEDTDDRSEIANVRDENGKIIYYSYKIYRYDKAPLSGRLTREEMDSIYRLYSYYGDNLTQRVVARHFSDLSLIDFKRVLRAFNITKASAPFAPHMIEEYTEDELRDIQLREKENSFLRKAEEDRIKDNERLLKQYAKENIDLKNQLQTLSEIKIEFPKVEPYEMQWHPATNKILNLYLADMHIGSSVVSGSLYEENVNYGKEEVKRRLTVLIEKIHTLGDVDKINLVLMGDNFDCCGQYGKTYKMTHDMPENMDPREQVNTFLEETLFFISSLVQLTSKMSIYSIPEGNHTGVIEYVANIALLKAVNAIYPEIQTTLWDKFYGTFTEKAHTFVCCHGRDSQFMKRGMPLNLDDATKVRLYEWLQFNNITGDNIHIVKGDLHSANINSCMMLDYRNVLSLYGASDYSSMNYSRNNYGLSYDIIQEDNLLRGEFINL